MADVFNQDSGKISYTEAVTNLLMDYYKHDDSYDSVFAAVSDAQDAVEEFDSFAATHTIDECNCYLNDNYGDKLDLSTIVANTSTTGGPCEWIYRPTIVDPVYPSNVPYTPPYTPPYIPTYPIDYCKCSTCLLYGQSGCPRTNSGNNYITTTTTSPADDKDQDSGSRKPTKKDKAKSAADGSKLYSQGKTKNADDNDPCVRRFHSFANALADQYRRKNEAYGDSFGKSVRKYGPISALTRMSDKWNRLESLMVDKNRNEVSDESINDTLLDLATYCVMTVMATNNEDTLDLLLDKLRGKC